MFLSLHLLRIFITQFSLTTAELNELPAGSLELRVLDDEGLALLRKASFLFVYIRSSMGVSFKPEFCFRLSVTDSTPSAACPLRSFRASSSRSRYFNHHQLYFCPSNQFLFSACSTAPDPRRALCSASSTSSGCSRSACCSLHMTRESASDPSLHSCPFGFIRVLSACLLVLSELLFFLAHSFIYSLS